MTTNPNILGSSMAFQGFEVFIPNPPRRPTSSDTGFSIPTWWMYIDNPNSTYEVYFLVRNVVLSGGIKEATWVLGATNDGPVLGLLVDTGTSPVTEDGSGFITVTGQQIANASLPNVIRTNGTASTTMTIQIQRAGSDTTTDTTLNGVCHFDSNDFSISSDGFVQLAGGSAITAIDVQATSGTGTDPVTPAAGVIAINGAAVANAAIPVQSRSAAINSLQIEVQRAGASASTNTTAQGLASFNNTQFSVDANGFVQLIGGGHAIDSVNVDAFTAPGTDPVLPNSSGEITVTGGQALAGTIPNCIQTNSLAANTYTIEIQRSSAQSATDATANGVCHFDSSQFTVDSNGFVQIAGGGLPVDSIAVDASTPPGTDPVLPDAGGLVTVTGAQVAPGTTTNVIRTNSLAANTYTIEIQRSSAQASSTVGANGVSHFNSAQFSVDSDGFVSLAGGGLAVDSFTPNSGTTPVVPDAGGNVAMQGSGSITVVGGLNSLTPQLTGLTNHAVLVGAGTDTITKVGPTAIAGQVLQSAGMSADPAFSTATYPSTTTINQILYSSAADTVSGLAAANNAVLTTGVAGVPVMTALSSNGQLIIGSGSGAPAAATLTAGAGISISNGANSITISASGSGLTWTDESGAFNATSNNGYFITATSTSTLPASPSQGDYIAFTLNTTDVLTIQASGSQTIRIGNAASSMGGTATSNAGGQNGDSIELIYRSANNSWNSLGAPQGSWSVA